MKRFHIILVAIIASLCLVQAAAALTASGVTTSPTQVNALGPGDIVSEVSGTINLPPSGSDTFDSEDSVEFYTQLDDAKWSISVVINGIENPPRTYGGKRATIGGYDLSYPSDDYEVKLKFAMEQGTVPASFKSGNINLVRVQELGQGGTLIGATVWVNGTVISTEALQATVDQILDDLTNLKTAIDEKAAYGVDVTIPNDNYEDAKEELQTAKGYLSSAPDKVQAEIDKATASIRAGQSALEMASADYSLDAAKTRLASVDGLITEFTENRSIKTSDARLVGIINKRDLSAQAISSANDFFGSANYLSAEGKANEGLNLANQAWNLSVELKTELDKGFTLPGIPNLSAFLPIFLVVAVILIVVGIIIYRRKMHWDELG